MVLGALRVFLLVFWILKIIGSRIKVVCGGVIIVLFIGGDIFDVKRKKNVELNVFWIKNFVLFDWIVVRSSICVLFNSEFK